MQKDDIITIVDLNLKPPKIFPLKLEILYEDDFIAVINKPAGISVSGNLYKTIVNALGFNLKVSTQKDALNWPLPVHRLDNQTSGMLIIAKTITARIELGNAFENKEVKKVYQAVVIGKTPLHGRINKKIDEKESLTDFKTIKTVDSLKNESLSLLELRPLTGRTHQLRIHCASLNTPILGDKIYGKPNLILKHKGLFLCAVSLKFNHPISKDELNLTIDTPHKFLKRLENEQRRFDNY